MRIFKVLAVALTILSIVSYLLSFPRFFVDRKFFIISQGVLANINLVMVGMSCLIPYEKRKLFSISFGCLAIIHIQYPGYALSRSFHEVLEKLPI